MNKRRGNRAVESGWPKRKITDFGTRLGFLLAQKDLSLTEFARMLGVSKQCVYGYKYTVYPNGKLVHKIAKTLDVPVYFFFAEDWVNEYYQHAA